MLTIVVGVAIVRGIGDWVISLPRKINSVMFFDELVEGIIFESAAIGVERSLRTRIEDIEGDWVGLAQVSVIMSKQGAN